MGGSPGTPTLPAMQAARTLRALPRRPLGRDLRWGGRVRARGPRRCEAAQSARRGAVPPSELSALLHGKLCARCVLGAAPARVAACRAQAEPGREDGAGYALPGEAFPPPVPVLGRFLSIPSCPVLPGFLAWGCPRGVHGAANLGTAGVCMAPAMPLRV